MVYKYVTLFVATVVAVGLFAQTSTTLTEAISQEDVERQNNESASTTIDMSASDSIEAWLDDVLTQFGLSSWGEQDGRLYAYGTAVVGLKSTDPYFGKAVATAYEKALLNAQQNLVMTRFGREIVDKANQFYRDKSSNAKDIPVEQSANILSKVFKIFDKSLDVANAKLDAELAELGCNQEEIRTMSDMKKKTLFKELFTKKIVKEASGEIAGIFPLQTALFTDKQGNARVGIVVTLSQKTIQIARDIAVGRSTLIKGRGRNIATEMKHVQGSDMLGNWGVRLIYDEDGTPAIVSYGIASYVNDTDDDYINQTNKDDARQAALDYADALIAEVVNGYMSTRMSRETGESHEQFVEREMKPDSLTTERVVRDVLDKSQRYAKSHASMDLKGVSTLENIHYKSKTGQSYYCAVRVWKYSTLGAIKNFNNPNYKAKDGSKGQATPDGNVGRKFNDIEDF